ncbi:ras-related protein Rab-9A isoform X1 [Stegostoma tigrinum]|uniref:ras-related protein Rab-9A isoform X1 n=1 Tax=Stegostoma tigrinum TaxID=3053191 RepID=UPI00202B4A88|nr:ras-related protein Rab-9A isoform X1 [Stegostoma tigrinum]
MNNLKEVIYRVHQIDKFISENNIQEVKFLMSAFEGIPVTPEILQDTDLVRTVYRVLKTCSDADTKRKAQNLLSVWKKLYRSSGFQAKCPEDRFCANSKEKSEKTEKINESTLKSELGAADSVSGKSEQQSEDNQIKDMLQETDNEKQLSSGSVVTGCSAAPVKQPAFITQAVRAKCIELLFQALIGSETTDERVVEMWRSIANKVEQYIHTLHMNNDKRYKTCIRSRIANLKNPKNPHLRQKILSGEVTPQMFAEMSVMDMASEELKHLRASYTTSGLQEHQLPHELEGTKTNKIRCKRCEKFNCTVTAIATGTLFLPGWVCNQNSDEQMMTFVICNECGEKWYNNGWISV